MSADQAILFVRAKRPNSIQTRGQLLCVREFAQFLVPLRSVFACAEPKASAVTLSQYLTRQRHLLHGYEARQMKNLPKIVQLVCKLLVDIAANRQAVIEEERLEIPDLTAEVEKTVSQQALQQLGNEMRGKGIPVPSSCSSHPLSPPASRSTQLQDQPLVSDNELDPLWRRQNAESPLRFPLSLLRERLSFSDSALNKLGARHLGHLKSSKLLIKQFLSHNSLTTNNYPRLCDFSPQGIISNIQYTVFVTPSVPEAQAKQDTTNPFSQKQPNKGHHSLPSDLPEQGMKPALTKSNLASSEEQPTMDTPVVGGAEREDLTEEQGRLPFIALQSELSLDARRLLVAKALAMDLTDKDLSSKVSVWQVGLLRAQNAVIPGSDSVCGLRKCLN